MKIMSLKILIRNLIHCKEAGQILNVLHLILGNLDLWQTCLIIDVTFLYAHFQVDTFLFSLARLFLFVEFQGKRFPLHQDYKEHWPVQANLITTVGLSKVVHTIVIKMVLVSMGNVYAQALSNLRLLALMFLFMRHLLGQQVVSSKVLSMTNNHF